MASVITLPTQELLDRLQGQVGDDVQLQLWPMKQPSGLGHIDLAVLPYMAGPTALDVLQGEDVAAVQAQSLGYDNMDKHLPEGVTLHNAVGVHEDSTAELTLALVLAAERDLPKYLAEKGQWNQVFSPGLLGRTVLIVGVGGVGEAIRARLEPFGCTITRSASRARRDEHGEVAGPELLPQQVAEADVVILVTPLTDATRHLVDADFLSHMKQGALLVNVGRGAVVDTEALVDAVRSGRIRCALDVVDPEPLPADHPLWQLDGSLVVPHVGGRSATMDDRVVALLVEQARHLAAGEPLGHRVL